MKSFTLTLILIFVLQTAMCQEFSANLQKYTAQYTTERVYIHFDKSAYAPGEAIWFKVYLMQGIYPTSLSKTLYIDWIDTSGQLIYRTLAPIVDGVTYGQFNLPQTYRQPYLHIKAYTSWMLNFDPNFLYYKNLPVLIPDTLVATKVEKEYTLTFFPEGGDLVNGVLSKVAFKITDQYGIPGKMKAALYKSGNEEPLDSLKAIHDGMGYFFLNPYQESQYSVLWNDENGKAHETRLPGAKPEGITLQVGILPEKRSFKVQSSASGNFEGNTMHIIGAMYGQPVFSISRSIRDGVIQGLIPTSTLPSGILVISVLDSNYHPVAERITYLKNDDFRFSPQFQVAHWGLSKRAKNRIEIEIPDSIVANLSVSVTDASIDHDTSHTVITELLLGSQIKGRVYHPAYYFQNQSDSLTRLLDLVMLTNGWRRFNWEAIATGNLPDILYPADTSYVTISGKILGVDPVTLSTAGDIILITTPDQGKGEMIVTPIQDDGHFKVPDKFLFDTTKVFYQLPQVNGMQEASVIFLQFRPPSYNVKAANKYGFLYSGSASGAQRHKQLVNAYLDEMEFYKGKVLETVTIEAPKKDPLQELNERYTSGLFSGNNGYSFDLLNDPMATAATSVFQYLQGRVAGLTINTSSNPPSLSWRGGRPAIFLNEMPVNAEVLEGVPVSDIALVKVLRPPFLGAPGGGSNGAIAVYTRKGGDYTADPEKGLSKNTIRGYTPIREFFAPDYSTFIPENERKDLRTTLYWNPEINMGPGRRKIQLQFFNSDVSEAFLVIIEGMTTDGRLAHIERYMK